MKYLHIMHYDIKFTESVIAFYNRFFQKNHSICLLNNISKAEEYNKKYDIEILNYNIVPKNIRLNIKFLNKIKKYDFIVFHYLNIPTLTQSLILFIIKQVMNKFIWIEWGADLYNFRDEGNTIKEYIKNKINYLFRSKIPNFIAIFPPDIDVYKQTFKNSKTKTFYAPYTGYPDGFKDQFYDSTRKLSDIINKKETLYIQIGHNAMPTLNHIEVLNALKHFSNENIKIILPLSYGNKEYADKVENYAKQLFSDKVICLRNFLSPDKYFDIIDKVSICIFNTQRQCALGNIHHMIFRNTKLFMPQDSVMFRYFNGRGVPIYSFDGIEKMDFKEFTSDVVIRNINNFNNYIEELTNYERKVALWKNIYDEIEKDCKK